MVYDIPYLNIDKYPHIIPIDVSIYIYIHMHIPISGDIPIDVPKFLDLLTIGIWESRNRSAIDTDMDQQYPTITQYRLRSSHIDSIIT